MDATLMAVLTGAVSATAGEAGKAALASLGALVRRLRGPGGAAELAVADLAAAPADGRVRATATVLDAEAAADPVFAAALREWVAGCAVLSHATLDCSTSGDGSVRNTIAGGAQVRGPVVQARDIHGGVNLG